jgi:hypothetical protein
MSRSSWTIEKWNNSLLTWESDGTIYRPNSDLNEEKTSNEQKFMLADGSAAFVAPEVPYSDGELTFTWLGLENTDLRDKINTYIENYDYLKITSHIAGRTYIGTFISLVETEIVGKESEYDLSAIFRIEE